MALSFKQSQFLSSNNPGDLTSNTAATNIQSISNAKSEQVTFLVDEKTGQLMSAFDGKIFTGKCEFRYEYDVAIDGGSASAKKWRGPKLPVNGAVRYGYIKEVSQLQGSGNITVGTATGTPANLLASTPININTFQALIPVNTPATFINISAESEPVIVPSATLTSGKLEMILEVTVHAA